MYIKFNELNAIQLIVLCVCVCGGRSEEGARRGGTKAQGWA